MSQILQFQQSLFDYADVPEADRGWLREQEDRISGFIRQTVASLFGMGEALLAVNNKLPRHFKAWLANNPSWQISRASAARYMDVAQRFSAHKAALVSHGENGLITPGTVRMLAEPCVRAKAIKDVLEKLGKGEPVTLAEAKEFVAKAKPESHRTRSFLQDDPEPEPVDSRAAVALTALETETRASTLMTISVVEDEEFPLDVRYVLEVMGKDKKRKRGFGKTMLEAVESLTGTVKTKTCSKCGETFPLETGFTVKESHSDGYSSECKNCSRERVKDAKLDLRYRKQKAATPSQAA